MTSAERAGESGTLPSWVTRGMLGGLRGPLRDFLLATRSTNAVGDMVSSLYVGSLLSSGRGALAFEIAASCAAAGALWVFIVGRAVASNG